MLKIDIENYFLDSEEIYNENKKLILVIYDIVDNKRRRKMVKFLEKYGLRVQKSAFEMILDSKKYDRLIGGIPKLIEPEDNVRVYRLKISGEVLCFGSEEPINQEVIII